MSTGANRYQDLDDFLDSVDGVADVQDALRWMSRAGIRWRISSGRWQKPCRGVIVAQSGPLSQGQILRVALLWAGPGAVLAGLTAARLDGFKGLADAGAEPVHLLVRPGRKIRTKPAGILVVVHYSRQLGPADVHPARAPRRTRIARSLVDAAAWMPTDRGAMAVLAAGVQQRLVRPEQLTGQVARNARLRRRKLIRQALADIAGGAQALSELDFITLVVRGFRLPEPDRQLCRVDRAGRRRYLDAAWDRWKVAVEIDGAAHLEALDHWSDMDRDNQLKLAGYQVLRFPAFVVRANPGYVARTIREALCQAGYPG